MNWLGTKIAGKPFCRNLAPAFWARFSLWRDCPGFNTKFKLATGHFAHGSGDAGSRQGFTLAPFRRLMDNVVVQRRASDGDQGKHTA